MISKIISLLSKIKKITIGYRPSKMDTEIGKYLREGYLK